MISSHALLLCVLLNFRTLAQDLSFPIPEYHHEIFYSSGDVNPEILPLSTASRIPSNIALHPAGSLFRTPVLRSVNLFTPNTIQQPAETPGQVENYRKALEEEAREAERAENAITTVFQSDFGGRFEGFRENRPKSYVSVQFDGVKKYDYNYQV